MRLLVLSDSHGDVISLRMAIESETTADAVIFLGDGINDIEQLGNLLYNKKTIIVSGNCDSAFAPYPRKVIDIFAEKKIYCTHGYTEHVKSGLQHLKSNAIGEKCDIAVYGHTHTPFTSYENGLYIMNPGSVRQNSYGIIDIESNGIICFTKKIVG
jgi:putative phosphoesterase